MYKQQKIEYARKLTETLSEANSVILVDYAGLGVKAQQDLKKRLKVVGATMTVSKNTLFKIAAKNAKYPAEILTDTVLSGPTALVIANEDPVSPLQVLAKFAEEFQIPEFKVGVVEGGFQDKEALVALSKLPSKEILAGQVVGAVAAPLYGLVGTLNAPMQKLVYILEQASKKQ